MITMKKISVEKMTIDKITTVELEVSLDSVYVLKQCSLPVIKNKNLTLVN